MIRTLDDVEEYSKLLAAANPTIADEIELRGPGMNDLDVMGLRRQMPGLPDDYVEIAQRWRLDDISIGYLNLRPTRVGDARSLAERLLAANSSASPTFGLLERTGLIEVADWEGNPVCLGAKGTARAGHVFVFDLATDPTGTPRFLARTFADLLKGATELHELSMSNAGPDGIEGFVDRLRDYIPAVALDEWRSQARMAT